MSAKLERLPAGKLVGTMPASIHLTLDLILIIKMVFILRILRTKNDQKLLTIKMVMMN